MKYHCFVKSPIDELLLLSDDGETLCGLYMNVSTLSSSEHVTRAAHENEGKIDNWLSASKQESQLPLFVRTKQQLDEYFHDGRQDFDLPLKMIGTEFQKSVWRQLLHIQYGTCITYGELAQQIGNPAASRAVGLANGRNPIGIIVPCHRVVGSNGTLTGYGGGLSRKRFLLSHESRSSLIPGLQLLC